MKASGKPFTCGQSLKLSDRNLEGYRTGRPLGIADAIKDCAGSIWYAADARKTGFPVTETSCYALPTNEGRLPPASGDHHFQSEGKGASTPKQLLAGLSPVGFRENEKRCRFAVPLNSVPKSFAVPAHDFELCDRALVPVFDLSQDRFDIFGYRALAQAGIGN